MSLVPEDIEAIERATFDAVPPESLHACGPWLVAIDRGTVGRARSAVPLRHAQPAPDALDAIEAVYAAHGLGAMLRVPAAGEYDALRAKALGRGYTMGKPTSTFTGSTAAMAALADGAQADLLAVPDDGWRAVFLGEGFDPVDGASRVQILARARHAVFARVQVKGETVAAGMGSFSQGWASVHGMRTLAPYRGQGLARQILSALGREAQRRGLERAFLQVEAANTGARALYRRAGFQSAWDYAYWTGPGLP